MKKTILLATVIPALALGALTASQVQACDEHCKMTPKKTIAKKPVAKKPIAKVTTAKSTLAKKPVVQASAKKAEPKKTGVKKIESKKIEIKKAEVSKVLDFKMKSLTEQDVDLSKYQGKVVMMVNVASKCGLTPQYQGLQDLHKKYSGQGLAILGFPANDFGQQEPGTAEEIGEFCQKNYGVEFDMFSKIAVTGENKAPLYKYLTSAETNPEHAGEISWNFEKFLIGRDGKIVARFAPAVTPTSQEVTKAIEAELAKK